jgi:lysophospholipase L1-like esterase
MNTPFNAVAIKLLSNVDSKIQILGDSTGQGAFDELVIIKHGWVGRLGQKLGIEFDANVRYLGAPYPGSTVWNGYVTDEMLHTSSRSSAPTLTIINGSMGGSRVVHLNAWIQNNDLIPDVNVDAVITAIGFNDIPYLRFSFGATFLPSMQSLVAQIRARGVTAPIVITSQNRSTGIYPTATYFPYYSQIASYYVGNPLNLTPAFQGGSAAFPTIWYLDTMQAYPVGSLSALLNQRDTLGGLHPNGAGYQAQADWMFDFFPPEVLPAPVITTTSLNTLTRAEAFSQTLTATAVVSWTVTSGALPDGLFLNPTSGTISGVPAAFGGPYTFTVRATNANGFDEQSYAGTIQSNALPFVANNTAQFQRRALGFYYPINQNVKISGSFKPVVTKN